MAEDDQEKTEDPTQRRLEDAKKKGQVAFSREVSNFFIVLALTLLVSMTFPWLLKSGSESLSKYISQAGQMEVSRDGFYDIALLILKDVFSLLGIPLLFFMAAAIGASLIQNGFQISFEPIVPKLEKLSLSKGFGRLFSMRSFMEFIKGLIKITIVGMVAYLAVDAELLHLEKLPSLTPEKMFEYIGMLVIRILKSCCIAIFFIAILDFMYQKYEHIKKLRMSKQEMKDEYKQQEGDPHIKGKLKQIRMQRARNRMMANVPTADVIVTNPIHYAIALKYDTEKASAPVVVAMGTDLVAERIKTLAGENDVPIVRNPTLARALWDDCELDQEIPFSHFQAVAEVISYVYKLKGKIR